MAGAEVLHSSRATNVSRTVHPAGCTDSSTRSNTTKPTGVVSMRGSSAPDDGAGSCDASRRTVGAPPGAASRRNTSKSYCEV